MHIHKTLNCTSGTQSPLTCLRLTAIGCRVVGVQLTSHLNTVLVGGVDSVSITDKGGSGIDTFNDLI